MNKKRSLMAVSLFVVIVVGAVYVYQVSEQKQSANLIKQVYSQIVFPGNFVRTNETATVTDAGIVSKPIQLYTYRADAKASDVRGQLISIFEKAGYRVTSSESLVEGFDRQLKLSASFEPENTSDVQVIKVSARRAND